MLSLYLCFTVILLLLGIGESIDDAIDFNPLIRDGITRWQVFISAIKFRAFTAILWPGIIIFAVYVLINEWRDNEQDRKAT